MDKIGEEYKPKITVITPTYNRAAFLDEIIRSVLAQDYKDFEYFILDDGSTDNTEEVVRPYLEDSRVRYLKHANTGEAETVNWGWNLAKGEYFTQVNSDDPILPGLFSEMVKILDEKKEFVVAYPDFYFINKEGKIIKKDKTPDWDFLDALAAFSCYAASAGTFIRKSAFQDWKVIKNSKYKHISDIDMYWKMALEGNFYHVPKFLATWRSHEDAISSERYKCIPEVHAWFNEYFFCKDIPNDILNIKEKVLNSINDYCIFLLTQSNVTNKSQLISEYKRKYLFKYKNLQVGDNDLIGNKFNGHDLHQYLREKRIDSSHLVWNKESTDANTFIISGDKKNRQEIYKFVSEMQKEYKLDGILNPIMLDIIYNKLFLESDIVHLHLMHNGLMDINLLPLLTKLKPTVWTLHDQWPLSGNCIQHFERECDQWKNSALIYELKKHAIQNSNVEIIVASKLMFNKVKESLAFNEKNIHLIPFGINQDIFKPLDKLKARIKLNIPKNALVISFRGDNNYKKGVDYVEYVIKNIKTNKELYFLVFGGAAFYKKNGCKYIEYGWIKDDFLMSDIYNASDLFLMPSIIESFGMMAIEAMSCETLPIVLDGDKTALPDIVNAPECGVSVKKDKEEYLKTVQFYIDHEKERKERANKCLEFARKNYNKNKYVDKIIEVYKEAMAKHKMSEEDEILLAQLKEYMVIEPKKEIDESFMCKIENTEIVNCSTQQFKVNTNSKLIAFLKKIVVMNTSPATRIFLKNKLNRLCQPKNNFKARARNLIKKIIKWVLFKSSITFRTLTYILNKETDLSWKIENFEKSNEQNIANLMQKFDNVEKSNEQKTSTLFEKIEDLEKLNKINNIKLENIGSVFKSDAYENWQRAEATFKNNYELNIGNNGERLVPGYSNDKEEFIKHRSTYVFFKKIIESDITNNPEIIKKGISILDLGSGVGHGTIILSGIINSNVVGVEIDNNAIDFAKNNYFAANIDYVNDSIDNYLKKERHFDYVVSRHVLEHVDMTINEVGNKLKYNSRAMISVPYKEKEGNIYHKHFMIDENNFSSFLNKEFFYEDLNGITDIKPFTDRITNSFTCVASKGDESLISESIKFPIEPAKIIGLEKDFLTLTNFLKSK